MNQRLTSFVLRLLKVPPEPQAPEGEPASLRIFHAGRNFFKLKLLGWGFGQGFALAGIVFWLGLFISLDLAVAAARVPAARQPAPAAASVAPTPRPAKAGEATVAATATSPTKPANPKAKAPRQPRSPREAFAAAKAAAVPMMLLLPAWVFPVLWVFKLAGLLAYFGQLAFTYVVARMDYELRWYMVTDRSLRIRHGVWNVAESTMSFANIQQVVVSQGPLQRLLGITDVRVQSAGGGSGGPHGKGGDDTLHTAVFHAVENASEVRDLIQERLRRFRATGLGDPDDHGDHHAAPVAAPVVSGVATPEAVAAAKELLAEARALRAAVAAAAGE
ncbi:MAG: PH domain-containing protein [Opitutus sp.]|nr:PH domain-containing protein [Opitutus sp.]